MKELYQKEVVLHPRKLDWMLLHKRNDIRKIMRDNGSFVEFPKMGTKDNLITVFAENQVNVERTLRSLHFLVSKEQKFSLFWGEEKKKRANITFLGLWSL